MDITFTEGVQIGAYLAIGYKFIDDLAWPIAVKLWNMAIDLIKSIKI